ncbi:hypothetical protein [Algoriphagus sp. CAU 1675]|uniref:hypothetical protein n=1 Tax=Algoriphagus sp. CAU 1675 TaxID=3032597 RepID=UPI0023DA7450|nr:hypothetical protein [Algoriphagus sp. CAU 1675]MDF2158932.1 hypothetical protein [Algoriphagus sp. CAU 1675]
MTVQINSNYLEKYAQEYASEVCNRFYSGKQYSTGQDIIQLTNSVQVNFFIIKRLFELWQDELAKLKSNPYFDYRDIAVHEALTQFMNVLSRRIKVERSHLEPLVEEAVKQAVFLATDPVAYYQGEIDNAPSGKINGYLKENKKYYKWNDQVVTFLIDKAGFGLDADAYKRAVAANFQTIQEELQSVNLLLATLGDVKAFDLDAYLIQEEKSSVTENPTAKEEASESFFDTVEKTEEATPKIEEAPAPPKQEGIIEQPSSQKSDGLIASQLWAKFSQESYKGMKGIIGDLTESVAINQRFMFTKELFDGNNDLLNHALKALDDCSGFEQAIDLVNTRFLNELKWNPESEPVNEFLYLVFRRFSD